MNTNGYIHTSEQVQSVMVIMYLTDIFHGKQPRHGKVTTLYLLLENVSRNLEWNCLHGMEHASDEVPDPRRTKQEQPNIIPIALTCNKRV